MGRTWARNRRLNSVKVSYVVSHRDFFRVFLNQNLAKSPSRAMIRLLLMTVEWVYLPIYLTNRKVELYLGSAHWPLALTPAAVTMKWTWGCSQAKACRPRYEGYRKTQSWPRRSGLSPSASRVWEVLSNSRSYMTRRLNRHKELKISGRVKTRWR